MMLKDPEFYERVVMDSENKIQSLQADLFKAQVELTVYKEKLEHEIIEHHKAKNQTHKLWNFIALRSRVDVEAPEGSARAVLQAMEQR